MGYQDSSTLEVLDNGIRFGLVATLEEGSVRIVARLVSSGNALVGDWSTWLNATGPKFKSNREPDWGHHSSPFDVMPPRGRDHGTIRLERLPVAAPRLVCPAPN